MKHLQHNLGEHRESMQGKEFNGISDPPAHCVEVSGTKHSDIYIAAFLSYTDDSSPIWRRCHEKTGNC